MSEPFFARLGATRLERAAWGTTGTSGIEATIDPLKTRTAAAADWHIRPLPGSDAALALGMTHIIVAEGLHDADYIAQYTLGFDLLCDTPQRRRAPRSF
jgi:anaerobic selenocysteine-containing dehydrogenase